MKKWKKVYIRAATVLAAAAVLSVAVYLSDNLRKIPENEKGESILKRNEYGGGSKSEELIVQTELGAAKIVTDIGEQRYTQNELKEVFSEAGKKLETIILGENTRLEEIRSNLNLVGEIPDTGIEVSWELSNYEVMNILGELQTEYLKEEGTLVELKALLSYGEEQAQHQFYVKVFPPELNDSERLIQKLKKNVEKADAKTQEEEYLVLPSEIDGIQLTWVYMKDMRGAGLFILGILAAGLVFALERQNEIDTKKERERGLAQEYPQFINTFTLYLGAGMPARRAWIQMAASYEKQEKFRYAYEEMAYAMHEMHSGVPESVCYEHFGRRCGISPYRKFGVLLSQNLKKGTKGLSEILQKEAAGAFEERKSMARKLGEETGTKLLGPMFLMLAVVLMIIVVPAFFTIQI